MNVDRAELERWAGQELERLLRQLPAPVRERAEEITILLERRPSRAQVRDGVDPDLMGLFEGDVFADGPSAALPARIYLFLENIWEEADFDAACFRDEVRITLLHELGHYLGLEEDDLAARDLE